MYFVVILLLVMGAAMAYLLLDGRRRRKQLFLSVDRSFGIRNREKTNLESVDELFFYRQNADPARKIVDAGTWRDLEMDRVFHQANACLTSAGEEYLYDLLHTVSTAPEKTERRERLIQWLESHEAERREIRRILAEVGKTEYNGVAQLLFSENKGSHNLSWVYRVLGVFPFFALLLFPFHMQMGFWALTVSFFLNSFLYYSSKKKLHAELQAFTYLSRLLWGCRKLYKAYGKRYEFFGDLESSEKKYKNLSRKIYLALQNSQGGLDLAAEYVKILTLSELSNYYAARKRISADRENLQELLEVFCEIDLAAGVLSYRKSLPVFCKPEFVSEAKLEFRGMYHPLLEHPVGNDAVLEKNSIITGSNASGKSTFLRAAAINCILAQSLNTCFGERFVLRRSQVVAVLSVRDDLGSGESFYMAEIRALKDIIDRTRETPVTCFIDEILRGTNSKERIAISAAYLDYLNTRNVLCIATTHDLDLAGRMEKSYETYYFSETLIGDDLVFDYKIKRGISPTGNAVHLLKKEGFPSAVWTEAERIAQQQK